MKTTMDLFANPLFKMGFQEFFLKMQQEGIEAAKKFWSLSPYSKDFPFSQDMYERIVDFYIVLGFVPRVKYDEVLKENKNLKEENQLLRNMIKDLQFNVFKEGGERAQQLWHDVIDKQIETNNEITKNFFELFRQLKTSN
jgi:hypothetical protein